VPTPADKFVPLQRRPTRYHDRLYETEQRAFRQTRRFMGLPPKTRPRNKMFQRDAPSRHHKLEPRIDSRRRFRLRHRSLLRFNRRTNVGLISQGLLPHVKKVMGVDISAGMVDAYNEKAKNRGWSEKMGARCVNILALPEGEIPKELRDVDVVVCSMSYHHIEDHVLASKVLASLLKKGGHLLVVDLLEGCSLLRPTNGI
jgi:SAM-dependent methyltransferase